MQEREAQELLARQRARIERALGDVARESVDPGRDEPAEAGETADEMVDDEIGAGLAERLQDELEAIERAERRLAEGTYGRSIESGEPIPDARLQAIPWAERTAEEQARYELQG
jgi:DnaK suppressor protein